MFRWARPLIVFLALLAVLASGTSGAWASKGSRHCDGMVGAMDMNMDDCFGGINGEGAGAPDCAALACGATQIVVPPQETSISSIIVTFASPLAPRDDLQISGLSGSPDLRPPIA